MTQTTFTPGERSFVEAFDGAMARHGLAGTSHLGAETQIEMLGFRLIATSDRAGDVEDDFETFAFTGHVYDHQRALGLHVDAVCRRLRSRLRQHEDHATRSSMSVTHRDLRVLLDALDRAKVGRAVS